MSWEKAPLQSKKFIGYMISGTLWKIVLIAVLLLGIKESMIDVYLAAVALAIVVVAGFIDALYLGGQASLDKYTRIAEIAAQAGTAFTMKNMSMKPKDPDKGPPAEG